jgi:hypothetical protein
MGVAYIWPARHGQTNLENINIAQIINQLGQPVWKPDSPAGLMMLPPRGQHLMHCCAVLKWRNA